MSFPTHSSLICCHVQQQPPGVAIGPWLESTQPQPEGSQGLGGARLLHNLTCVLMRMAPMEGISK